MPPRPWPPSPPAKPPGRWSSSPELARSRSDLGADSRVNEKIYSLIAAVNRRGHGSRTPEAACHAWRPAADLAVALRVPVLDGDTVRPEPPAAGPGTRRGGGPARGK